MAIHSKLNSINSIRYKTCAHLMLLALMSSHCVNSSKSVHPVTPQSPNVLGQNMDNANIVQASSGATQISGSVTRSIGVANSGRGTLCVAIGTSCLATNTYQSFHGLSSLSIPNVDFSASGAQTQFSFTAVAGKLQPGTTYYVIASLQDGGGECWMVWKKNNLFTWQNGAASSPCASFTYQEGKSVSHLAVNLNGLIPFDYVVNPSQLTQNP